jgi:hypothetical protein
MNLCHVKLVQIINKAVKVKKVFSLLTLCEQCIL